MVEERRRPPGRRGKDRSSDIGAVHNARTALSSLCTWIAVVYYRPTQVGVRVMNMSNKSTTKTLLPKARYEGLGRAHDSAI